MRRVLRSAGFADPSTGAPTLADTHCTALTVDAAGAALVLCEGEPPPPPLRTDSFSSRAHKPACRHIHYIYLV
eukprot:SAG11_NODE_36684_length_260_cov_0.956522_1_plen_72_part_10